MATQEDKTCSRCKQLKAASEFSPDRREKTGLQPACRNCSRLAKKAARDADLGAARAKEKARYRANPAIRERNLAWRANNPEKVAAGKSRYYERVKSTPKFQARVKALQTATKAEKRLYDQRYRAAQEPGLCARRAKAWIKANPEKRRAICFAYDGKRRAQKAAGVTGPQLKVWTAAQIKVCHWCSKRCAKAFHVDHIMPLSRGGEHEIRNLAIACPQCNLRKNARDPVDWARMIGKLI